MRFREKKGTNEKETLCCKAAQPHDTAHRYTGTWSSAGHRAGVRPHTPAQKHKEGRQGADGASLYGYRQLCLYRLRLPVFSGGQAVLYGYSGRPQGYLIQDKHRRAEAHRLGQHIRAVSRYGSADSGLRGPHSSFRQGVGGKVLSGSRRGAEGGQRRQDRHSNIRRGGDPDRPDGL